MNSKLASLALSVALLAVAAAVAAAPARAAVTVPAARACRATAPAFARTVLKPLTQPRLAWFKRQHGLTELDARRLRPLTDARDAATCRQLDRLFAPSFFGQAPWEHVYYEAQGYYFASYRDTTDPRSGRAKVNFMIVLDRELRPLGWIAPK